MDLENKSEVTSGDWADLEWTNWTQLHCDNPALSDLPKTSGLYRVKHKDREGLEYVGQTGRKLRERVRSLANNTHKDEQPGNAPHTAAPHLWKLKEKIGEGFQVSVANPNIARSEIDLYGLEYLLVALHIQSQDTAPTVNLDRSHVLKSLEERAAMHTELDSIDYSRQENVLDSRWMGLDWSQPDRLVNRLEVEPGTAVYRIWFENHAPPLAYIGQAKNIKQRLYKHEKKFGEDAKFSIARVKDSRKTLEALIIGKHYQTENTLPKGQEGRRNKFELEFN
ncbi:MAG: GIY-YIG nuclease family protein [Candidatus Nanohalobium sp.]